MVARDEQRAGAHWLAGSKKPPDCLVLDHDEAVVRRWSSKQNIQTITTTIVMILGTVWLLIFTISCMFALLALKAMILYTAIIIYIFQIHIIISYIISLS
jgi:hypothetical protein